MNIWSLGILKIRGRLDGPLTKYFKRSWLKLKPRNHHQFNKMMIFLTQ